MLFLLSLELLQVVENEQKNSNMLFLFVQWTECSNPTQMEMIQVLVSMKVGFRDLEKLSFFRDVLRESEAFIKIIFELIYVTTNSKTCADLTEKMKSILFTNDSYKKKNRDKNCVRNEILNFYAYRKYTSNKCFLENHLWSCLLGKFLKPLNETSVFRKQKLLFFGESEVGLRLSCWSGKN